MLIRDLPLESRHHRLVPGHDLRRRLQNRFADIRLIRRHSPAARQLNLPAEQPDQRRTSSRTIRVVAVNARQVLEQLFADLRQHCAEELLRLEADGYAIGGLSVGEPRALSLEMTEVVAPLLPRDRPRYVMGVGMPDELPEYVARGVDMMDCVLPSRNARNGYFFTSAGRVIIKQTQYKDDPRPVDETCGCYCCRTFSRAYLRHLFLASEMTFSTLATLHNLKRYFGIMRTMRRAILDGSFPDYLRDRRSLAQSTE